MVEKGVNLILIDFESFDWFWSSGCKQMVAKPGLVEPQLREYCAYVCKDLKAKENLITESNIFLLRTRYEE